MMSLADRMTSLEPLVNQSIRIVGTGIEVFGVLVIVLGLLCSTNLYLHQRIAEPRYEAYGVRIGRTLLLGLEVLVAADIVKTIAAELSLTGLGMLAGLVLVRTFLSWTLALEIEGRRLGSGSRPAVIDSRALRPDSARASA
jgi:uncharacterized membrane protein